MTFKTPGNFLLLPLSAEPPDLDLWQTVAVFWLSFLTKFLFYSLAGQAMGFFYPIIITSFSLDSVFLAHASFFNGLLLKSTLAFTYIYKCNGTWHMDQDLESRQSCCTLMCPKSSLSFPSLLDALTSNHSYLSGSREHSPLHPWKNPCIRKGMPTFSECFYQ